MDFIKNHAWDLWSAIAGLITGGAAGSLITIKLVCGQNASGTGSNVHQSRVNAGGDVVGGDKSTNIGSGRRR